MRRIWLAVAVLAAMLFLAAAENIWMHESLTDIVDLLDRSEWHVDEGEWERAEECVWDALGRWEAHSGLLSILVRQQNLDEGSILLEKAAETLRVRQREQYKIDVAGLEVYLLRLARAEQPVWSNLL